MKTSPSFTRPSKPSLASSAPGWTGLRSGRFGSKRRKSVAPNSKRSQQRARGRCRIEPLRFPLVLTTHNYGFMVSHMKTTVDLPDDLLILAKKRAAEQRRPLRALLAEALRSQLAGR